MDFSKFSQAKVSAASAFSDVLLPEPDVLEDFEATTVLQSLVVQSAGALIERRLFIVVS